MDYVRRGLTDITHNMWMIYHTNININVKNDNNCWVEEMEFRFGDRLLLQMNIDLYMMNLTKKMDY